MGASQPGGLICLVSALNTEQTHELRAGARLRRLLAVACRRKAATSEVEDWRVRRRRQALSAVAGRWVVGAMRGAHMPRAASVSMNAMETARFR